MSGFFISDNPTVENAGLIYSTGWATYNDSEYTDIAPEVIAEDEIVNISNNAAVSIEGQLPSDDSLYDSVTQRVFPNEINDAYIIRVTFKAYSTSQTGRYNIGLDISPLGDNSMIAVENPTTMLRGSGLSNARVVDEEFVVFSSAAFVANGGRIFIESVTGDTNIYNTRISVFKIHGGR